MPPPIVYQPADVPSQLVTGKAVALTGPGRCFLAVVKSNPSTPGGYFRAYRAPSFDAADPTNRVFEIEAQNPAVRPGAILLPYYTFDTDNGLIFEVPADAVLEVKTKATP
jgi:hypothetical protein